MGDGPYSGCPVPSHAAADRRGQYAASAAAAGQSAARGQPDSGSRADVLAGPGRLLHEHPGPGGADREHKPVHGGEPGVGSGGLQRRARRRRRAAASRIRRPGDRRHRRWCAVPDRQRRRHSGKGHGGAVADRLDGLRARRRYAGAVLAPAAGADNGVRRRRVDDGGGGLPDLEADNGPSAWHDPGLPDCQRARVQRRLRPGSDPQAGPGSERKRPDLDAAAAMGLGAGGRGRDAQLACLRGGPGADHDHRTGQPPVHAGPLSRQRQLLLAAPGLRSLLRPHRAGWERESDRQQLEPVAVRPHASRDEA